MPADHLGPFDLELDIVEANVTRTGPGTFRLGHNDVWGQLCVRLIGRSDDDLKGELRRQALKKKYTRFTFQFADTSRQSYERCCRDYHRYRGNGYLDNTKHPYTPNHHDYPCPICKKIAKPPSAEVRHHDEHTKKSSGMVLKLADEGLAKQEELKPWEMDEEGKKIRKFTGDGETSKPWMFDDPNTIPLDVEHLVNADKQLSDAAEENAKKQEEAGIGIPEWLASEDEINDNDLAAAEKKEKKEKKPWELDDED
ncbi:MAG: hypothetical protein OEM52_02520 [bacterium]|nr:hypothetical protein [bacterium]